ncbi:MAG: tail fiber domain-containing protein [Chthoniobacterales bacterium]|nr:tail fiber domain-containing protein [Chthoniobacterales bacterium]
MTGTVAACHAGRLRSNLMKILHSQIALTCLLVTAALASSAFAVDPPPNGGYPGNNTALGTDALFSLTIGNDTTAIGFQALFSATGGYNTAVGSQALYRNTGSGNTAVGTQALFGNTIGFGNTANGSFALNHNTTGSNNTANGFAALELNTTGSNNTAAGYAALDVNTTGSNNTAAGFEALVRNATGSNNTANGSFALQNNTTGSNSAAEGFEALYSSTTGGGNVANGYQALRFNTTGSSNTANGWRALYKNTSASNNTADGYWALNNNTTGLDNTALGYSALFNNTIGSNNIALGPSAGTNLTTGSNNIDIGAVGGAGESNTIRIGRSGFQTNAYITGISGVTVAGGVSVIVDPNGHLGTLNSSARYKEAIQPMGKTSEAILALKPVTFRYKEELDAAGVPQFGLVAEEVEKVNPDLVARDDRGKPYTVRYEAVNAMLLNEFLKEHRKVESLEKAMAEQQRENLAMRAILKEQAAQILKVSDQFAASQAAPPMLVENR